MVDEVDEDERLLHLQEMIPSNPSTSLEIFPLLFDIARRLWGYTSVLFGVTLNRFCRSMGPMFGLICICTILGMKIRQI